ncbi:hypothetical protein BD779DRAFT_1523678 [Infundibulicybe gibba]|nr:hypothetical protein BD779DRAFT_1523678 [Infundibulicybe gibba]
MNYRRSTKTTHQPQDRRKTRLSPDLRAWAQSLAEQHGVFVEPFIGGRGSPDLQAWAQSLIEQHGVFVEHPIGSCSQQHGTNSIAAAGVGAERAANDSHFNYFNFAPPIVIGVKPSPGEKVIIVQPFDNDDSINLRIWGSAYDDIHVFSFDFVNRHGRYMRTPNNIKIHSDGPGPRSRVLSIERLSRNPGVPGTYGYDNDWETYVVPEGTKLCITRPRNPPCHITIPSRKLRAGKYVAVSEYW